MSSLSVVPVDNSGKDSKGKKDFDKNLLFDGKIYKERKRQGQG
jgi:hypothetical protein